MNSNPTTPTERVADNESATEAVVLAVAEATDADPLDLDPLYDCVDPDALDDLFESGDDGTARLSGSFTFEYEGCDVAVHADQRVVVAPTSDRAAAATPTATSD
jgi:hypothetical protein